MTHPEDRGRSRPPLHRRRRQRQSRRAHRGTVRARARRFRKGLVRVLPVIVPRHGDEACRARCRWLHGGWALRLLGDAARGNGEEVVIRRRAGVSRTWMRCTSSSSPASALRRSGRSTTYLEVRPTGSVNQVPCDPGHAPDGQDRDRRAREGRAGGLVRKESLRTTSLSMWAGWIRPMSSRWMR